MTTRQTSKEIVKYILTTIGLDADVVENVTGDKNKINTVERLQSAEQAQLTSIENMSVGDIIDIQRFQAWAVLHEKTDETTVPNTLEEWKTVLTTEKFASTTRNAPPVSEIIGNRATVLQTVPVPSINSKNSYVTVRIADYPAFSGRHQDWFTFKTKTEALARLNAISDVLNIGEVNIHLEKRVQDPEYDQKVRNLYGILELKTADSTASTTVTKFSETQDGALGWKISSNTSSTKMAIKTYSK